jgi:hypothetical protein
MGPVTKQAICVSILMVSAVPGPAFAWGPQAHRVIARVAEERLTPAARAAVRDLLHEGDTLADIANWADNEGHDAVPGSAPWHYVNVPITASRYSARYCARGGCVVDQIKHFRAVLADRSASKRDRARALLFLVHFVGDIHQPLHVGDNNDRGGNLTQIQFLGRGTNLHRVWDSDLIHHVGGNDGAWIRRVERAITPEAITEWSSETVENWADESLRVAQRAYRDPARPAGPMLSGTRLGENYAREMEPFLVKQMARAGVRLANELNGVFTR